MKRVRVAIIGAGPRGLAVLERLSALLEPKDPEVRFDIHVVDPGKPGQGIHRDTQPDHLLTNTAAGSTTVFVDASVTNVGPPWPGPNLRQWLEASGYRLKQGHLVQATEGDPIVDDLFIPRAILGTYLNWAYDQFVARMPAHVAVRHHPCRARTISRGGDGRFEIALENGSALDVDFVFLTTGHNGSGAQAAEAMLEQRAAALRARNPKLAYVRTPDPIERLDEIDASARVAVCGMGLTAFDVLSMFTHGRGGSFSKVGDQRLRYHPSGREPRLTLFSRQGLPSVSKPVDRRPRPVRGYQPQVFTTALVDQLKRRKGKLDWHRDLLPQLEREMALRLADSEPGGAPDEPAPEHMKTIDMFLHPWEGASIADSQAHAAFVRRYLEEDIAASFAGNVAHPLMAIVEIVRDLNDVVRHAVDYCGLTSPSHGRFLRDWCSIANRIAAGPPKERTMELLALVEAGVLSIFEPDPAVTLSDDLACFEIVSNAFGYARKDSFDVLIQARVGLFQPHITTDPLLRGGLDTGLFSAFDNDGFAPSGIAIDEALNVIDADGRSVPNCWAMGYVVEGAHYYTYVLPCPFANSRSLRDAGKAVMAMIAQADMMTANDDDRADKRELARLAD